MPRRILAVVALLAAALLLSGCGDSHASLMEETVDTMKELNKTLASVKDAESAEDAKGDLEDFAAKMKDIEKRMQALGTPTEEQLKEMMESVDEAEMERVSQEMMANMARIMFNPELSKHMPADMGGGPMIPGMNQ